MKNIYNKPIYLYMTIFSIVIMIPACTTKQDKKESEGIYVQDKLVELTKEQIAIAGILMGKASKRNIGTELKVNGIIDVPPHSRVSINLPYGGFLKDTKMLPGTMVKKGQLLAIIENPEFIQFQQDYLESLAQQEYLKAEYVRQKELFREEVSSERTYQLAKSEYLANDVHVRTMGDRLELIGFNLNRIRKGETSASVSIYSPISGSVRDVYTNVGKYINPQDPIMEITDTKDLHVELSVYENDIPHIQEGQKIRFTVTNSPNQIREAEVFLVGSSVREDHSVTVHGHLRQVEKDLLPGMYVSANLIVDTNEAWTVSKDAVVRYNGKHFVYVLNNNHQENNQNVYSFELKEVIKGMTETDFIQIEYLKNKNDINSDTIVLKGAYSILSESKISEEEGH